MTLRATVRELAALLVIGHLLALAGGEDNVSGAGQPRGGNGGALLRGSRISRNRGTEAVGASVTAAAAMTAGISAAQWQQPIAGTETAKNAENVATARGGGKAEQQDVLAGYLVGRCTGSSAALPAVECTAWQNLLLNTSYKQWTQHCSLSHIGLYLDPCSCATKGFGPTCENVTMATATSNITSLHLTGVQLAGWHLAGSLPSDFFLSLPALRIVNLASTSSADRSINALVGTIPTAGLGDLSMLMALNLSGASDSYQSPGNCFTGSLPAALGALTALRLLDVTDNELDGALPAELALLNNTLRNLQVGCMDHYMCFACVHVSPSRYWLDVPAFAASRLSRRCSHSCPYAAAAAACSLE